MTTHTGAWHNRVIGVHEAEHRYGEKLLPCPFCCSNVIALWAGPNPHITCGGCGADGPVIYGREEIEYRQHLAVRAWNTRGPQPVRKA